MRPLAAVLLFTAWTTPALAASASPVGSQLPPPRSAAAAATTGCEGAVSRAAVAAGVPVALARAIARVESGRRQADGAIEPWPWSIDVEGTDHVYESEAAAILAVRAFEAAGVRSIDVGCMQVNLMYHPDAFATLEDGFDPGRNAAYAMRFLNLLHAQTGDWNAAAARYHSATPNIGAGYLRRVLAEMAVMGPIPAAVSPPAGPAAGPIHLAASVPAFASGARGRTLADYRAIPVTALARR